MTERLLENLRCNATARGLVLVSEAQLMSELGASREAVEQAIQELARERRLEILSPLPYAVLALKPHPWSGSSVRRVQEQQQSNNSDRSSQKEVPVSSSSAAAATQPEDGGAGEGERLLEHVLSVLGPDADRDEFRAIIAGHQPTLVQRCLRRVQATTAIRVSRAALFRSLLQKLSH